MRKAAVERGQKLVNQFVNHEAREVAVLVATGGRINRRFAYRKVYRGCGLQKNQKIIRRKSLTYNGLSSRRNCIPIELFVRGVKGLDGQVRRLVMAA
jgi:hypothetical protein